MTKVLFDEADDRVIGAGIVGPNAGDLIAEVALAIEMGADATDIGQTIHPHPTLSETINFACRDVRGHDHRPDPAEEAALTAREKKRAGRALPPGPRARAAAARGRAAARCR